ncbi:MAG: hypothetical protein WC005_01440 [Candidatus Nanopelagicales bacterium]
MTRDPGVPAEDAAWQAIVADLSQDPNLVRHTFIAPAPQALPEGEPEADAFIDALLGESDAEFEPPDPGPLELPSHPVARFAWAGALGGPVVLLLANVLNWGSFIAGLGVAAAIAGFVTLVARHSDERDDDFTDGAVI